MGGDSYAPLTRGETHEEIVVPGPTFAANDNETLDHLLSLVDDNINVGAFPRFGKTRGPNSKTCLQACKKSFGLLTRLYVWGNKSP